MLHRNDQHQHQHHNHNEEANRNKVSRIHQNVRYRNDPSVRSLLMMMMMMLVITTICLLSFISVLIAQFKVNLQYNHRITRHDLSPDDTTKRHPSSSSQNYQQQRHRRQTSPIVINQTNSIYRNVTVTNTTTNIPSSMDHNHTTLNYTFCQAPHHPSMTSENTDDDNDNERYSNTCKAQHDEWNLLLRNKNVTTTNSTNSTTDMEGSYPSKNLTKIRSRFTHEQLQSNIQHTHHSKRQRRQQQTNVTNDDSICPNNNQRNDELSGECGPHCRPSCITLQLSLKQFQQNYIDDILCSHDTSSESETNGCNDNFSKKNKCVHMKRQSQPNCDSSASSSLYEQFPTCYLEDAKCFGPSIYDDIVALYERRYNVTTTTTTTNNSNNNNNNNNNNNIGQLPHLDHCTILPRDQLLMERFHDWPLVSPMKVDCDHDTENTSSSCFKSSSGSNSGTDNDRIYFEYCNIVEDDYDSCDSCIASRSSMNRNTRKCDKECTKVIKPFPSGWTTFVVSASIPYYNATNMRENGVSACRNDIRYANETGVVCFLQRIELYYPENCPYCHSCPYNVGLGDTFGPLEVVGFGHVDTTEHHQQHMCAPCNVASKIRTAANASLSCSQIQQCHESVDCSTGISLGIPSYSSNQCSFQNPSNDEDDLVQEDSITDDDNVEDDDSVTNPGTDDDDNNSLDDTSPTNNPTTKKPDKKRTDAPTTVPVTISIPSTTPVVVTTNPAQEGNNTVAPPSIGSYVPSTSISNDSPSKEFRFSPIIATFIVIALIIVITIQLVLYKKRVVETVRQQQHVNKNTEEILYIEEPLEFDGIDKILSKKDNNSDDNCSQQTATENDNDDNASQDPANNSTELHGRWTKFLGSIASQRRSVSIISVQQQQPEILHFHTASIVERSDQNEVEALYMTGQHHVQQQILSSSCKI